MLLHLFDEDVSTREIIEMLPRLSLKRLPLLNNSAEQETEKRSGADEKALSNVLAMIEGSSFGLHLIYQLQYVALPMLSVFVCGSHIISAVYRRSGIRFSEVINLKDIGRLLYESFATIPLTDTVSDQVYTVQNRKRSEDLINDPKDIELMPKNAEESKALLEAVTNHARIECRLDDGTHSEIKWYAVADKERIFSVIENEGTVQVITGSAYPLMNGLNQVLLEQYKLMLEMIKKTSKM